MKKKKIVTFTVVLALVVVLTGIALYAYAEHAENQKIEAGEIKLYQRNDGKTVRLEFVKTDASSTDSEKKLQKFTDSDGNVYNFNEKGNFISYENNYDNAPLVDTQDVISEQKAIENANKYAKDLFGKRFDGFKFDSISIIDGSQYFVVFQKYYGKEDCIIGEMCTLKLYLNGDMYDCMIPGLDDFSELDTESIADITRADIEAYVKEQLKDEAGIINYEVENAYLSRQNNEYVILINTGVFYENSSAAKTVTMSI